MTSVWVATLRNGDVFVSIPLENHLVRVMNGFVALAVIPVYSNLPLIKYQNMFKNRIKMSKKSKKNLTDVTDDLQLDDSAIAQIAKILQMAILTGTDVVDNLRLMRLVNEGGKLVPSEDYAGKFQDDVDHMAQDLSEKQESLVGSGKSPFEN